MNSTSNTKPWPVKMVESNGDYLEESWLEGERNVMYSNQSELPNLPIPLIKDTLKRFVPTAMPLAESEKERRSLQNAVDKFATQASTLQQRLLDRFNDNKDSSWLQHWWNTLGYLQIRDSVVINVSYYFNFQDDKTIIRTNNSDVGGGTSTSPQIQRAAAILYASGKYRNLVTSGRLKPDTIGRDKKPLCMTAYKYMFHACRIPRPEQDSYRIYDPSVFRHAIVAYKGRFYTIPLIDNATGEVFSVSVLESSLKLIMQSINNDDDAISEIGYLTGDNRDVWAKARASLLECPGMPEALELLESGCVVLNLETTNPVSKAQCGRQYLYGNGYNRWYDKSVQLVVSPNGKAGLIGEHSMMDGMPVIGLANYVVNSSYKQALNESSSSLQTDIDSDSIFEIFDGITLSSTVLEMIETSKQNFQDWTGKHEHCVQSFQGYGSNRIKTFGFSPDAYVQIAMQVATSRLFQKQVGTYEATMVRSFLHGRTETTRTVSPQSSAFVKAMNDFSFPNGEKINLLKAACSAHSQYIGNASKGFGIDRHFLGLSLLLRDNEHLPDLYSDPVFIRSKKWRVSTSNLTTSTISSWGYGEVVPDGVGLSYAVDKNHVMFGITALKENEWTERLSEYLEDTLCEMKLLIESNKDFTLPKSKL